jgi:hypothetical protein
MDAEVKKDGNRLDITLDLAPSDPRDRVETWKQGDPSDSAEFYVDWVEENEKHLVREESTKVALCYCHNPDDAKWIAARLNAFAKFERESLEYMAECLRNTPVLRRGTLTVNGKLEGE